MLPTYLQNILFRLCKYPIRRPIYVASFLRTILYNFTIMICSVFMLDVKYLMVI